MADCDTHNTSESCVKSSNFICGVVEGFYGRPWTTDQRKDLFQKMKKWGMESYVYAPKDDYKHRAYWRELYTVEEAEHLTGLISAARAQGVQFYYALSPGLDITYSSHKEVAALKRKLEQVSQFGCTAFALLFDDIEPEMSESDKEIFQSFAHAQVSVTNEIQQHLGGASVRFLLCPTQYCSTRAQPSVIASEYLSTLGAKLSMDIDIMWTGPKVISKILTPACIQEITGVLRRPPVIWDNLHANDYDQKRMFLGPYTGRSPELIPLLRGVLSNPNCEYNANMVPIRTLAHWADCTLGAPVNIDSVAADIKLETEGGSGGDDEGPVCVSKHVYHHRQALRNAIAEWLPEFSIERSASGPIVKPQPIVNIAAVPIIPILPSVNTCMSLTTTTATLGGSGGNTSLVAGCAAIPTLHTSQLQALADICTTVSAAENFNPTPNPMMNSLVSATKVVTNESIPNPIHPIASSNISMPSQIPVTTIQVPIMGIKSFGDGEIIGTDPLKCQGQTDKKEQLATSLCSKFVSDKCEVTDGLDVRVSEVGKGEQNGGVNSELEEDEDSNTDIIIVDDQDDRLNVKETQNGAMSTDSPCTSSPQHSSGMECTPDQENIPNMDDHQITAGKPAAENTNSDGDVVMADSCNENGSMQVESSHPPPVCEMLMESNDSNESMANTADNLTTDDLMLLCDLFYLPFEHGNHGLKLLQEFNWLKYNAPVLLQPKRDTANNSESQEWHSRFRHFGVLCKRVSRMSRRLGRCRNRELLHDLWGYVWDLRAVVGLLHAYVKWLALEKFQPNICNFTQGSYTWFSKGWKEAFMSGDQEPWVFRGGLTADLQRLIPLDNGNDLLAYKPPTSPSAQLYMIRPYTSQDKEEVNSICHKTCRDGMDCTDLFPKDLQALPEDRLVGPYLSLVPELCMVAQEESVEEGKEEGGEGVPRIMGYACAALDAPAFHRRQEAEWAPAMREKYPMRTEALSQVAMDSLKSFHFPKYSLPDIVHRHHPAVLRCSILPHCTDSSAPKRLLTCLLAALRSQGCFGVHVCIYKTDHHMNQFYSKLGFIEITQDLATGHIYLGRTF